MTNYLITRTATAQGLVTANLDNIYSNIDANPATTRAAIQAALSLSADIVNYMIDKVLAPSQIVVHGNNIAGTEFLWTAGDWAAALTGNIAAARTWLTTNDNNTTAQMASEMGIHEAIAIALAFALQWELKAQLTPQ